MRSDAVADSGVYAPRHFCNSRVRVQVDKIQRSLSTAGGEGVGNSLVILRLAPVYSRKRGEEGILGQILGGVGLVHKLQANRVDELLVLLHQTGKFFICQFPHLLSL